MTDLGFVTAMRIHIGRIPTFPRILLKHGGSMALRNVGIQPQHYTVP